MLSFIFLSVLIRVQVVELLQVFVDLSLLLRQLVIKLPSISLAALVGLVVEEPLLEELEALLSGSYFLS